MVDRLTFARSVTLLGSLLTALSAGTNYVCLLQPLLHSTDAFIFPGFQVFSGEGLKVGFIPVSLVADTLSKYSICTTVGLQTPYHLHPIEHNWRVLRARLTLYETLRKYL
jgi:hypothetical protein